MNKTITVKLTEDQAFGIINALKNNWIEMDDYEFKPADLQAMIKTSNAEKRKANAFMERIIGKLNKELAKS